jgi:hypothetical protein
MTTRTNCGGANILGGYNVTAGTSFYKSFDLSSFPHTEIRVELDYYVIDSWDGERATVHVTGSNVDKMWYNDFGPHGVQNTCGAGWSDAVYHVEMTGTHTGNTATVTALSNLNSLPNDESFGIDNVEIWVR